MFRDYPWRDAFLLDRALKVREAVSCPLVYLGGAHSAPDIARVMAAGFDYVQIGRALLADTDMPQRVSQDPAWRARCIHCNECAATIEHPDGVHCTRF